VIGEVLGSYRIVAKLGAGGMGTVYLAEHKLLGSRAAIKVLQPGMSSQEKIVQRFFDEARAATRIRDPGIVTVLDFGWHHGDAYIVMELLSGATLTQRLGLSQMPPLQAMRLVQMAALAMAAAHGRGIIHRDLKPDNIFVVNDPAVPGGERVKILDFGIAKLIDRDPDAAYQPTVDGTIMGTPAYMSPEQCRAVSNIDHRTDIYALGCVLFHLLCGRPPFIAQSQGDMIVAQIQEDPPHPRQFVANLAPEIDALVMRCLAKNPDERFQTMTDIVRAASVITGDNHAVDTIPPMLAGDHPPGLATMISIYPTPGHVVGVVGTPSQSGEMVAVARAITSPPVTTLHGSATALDTASAIHRPRYGIAAILILGLAGAIVLATVLGGHHEQASMAHAADATVAPADAVMLVTVPVDAAPMATVIDAAPPRDAATQKTLVRPRKYDAGIDTDYSHR
jgi:eukaryotic-like serine/threonine-protein kinase